MIDANGSVAVKVNYSLIRAYFYCTNLHEQLWLGTSSETLDRPLPQSFMDQLALIHACTFFFLQCSSGLGEGPTLTDYVHTVKQHLPNSILSFMVIGMEKYFR